MLLEQDHEGQYSVACYTRGKVSVVNYQGVLIPIPFVWRKTMSTVLAPKQFLLEPLALETIPLISLTCKSDFYTFIWLNSIVRKASWGKGRLEDLVRDQNLAELSEEDLLSRLECIMMNDCSHWPDQQIVQQSQFQDNPGPFAKHGEQLRWHMLSLKWCLMFMLQFSEGQHSWSQISDENNNLHSCQEEQWSDICWEESCWRHWNSQTHFQYFKR